MLQIINIREHQRWLESAADYFSSKWGIDRKVYQDSMANSLTTDRPYPRWYLLMRDETIIGGFGLIKNDFMVRTDFCPWLCALYIEETERGQALGAKLLSHARKEAAKLGFEKLYLNTGHIGYYEKYGWRYIGEHDHISGEKTRVYEAEMIRPFEEMAVFFDARADCYDSHMLGDLKLNEFYNVIAACCAENLPSKLLDLGCGTGLELERLYTVLPDIAVTGIDMSLKMLSKMKEKYSDKNIRLICGSYFDVDFEGEYDCVLSTYSLHHFSEERKLALYRKIRAVLKRKGRFVLGDYTVSTMERQRELMAANDALRKENGVAEDEYYHFDTPFTAETEIALLKEAGFATAELVRQWENTSIIVAEK